MNKNQLKQVVDFYQKVIVAQIIKPVEIKPVYKLVKPDGLPVPYYRMMREISIYVQALQQEVLDGLEGLMTDFDTEQEELANTDDPRSRDYVETVNTKGSAADTSQPQSHSEGSLFKRETPIDKSRLGDTEEVVGDKVHEAEMLEGDIEEVEITNNKVELLLLQNQYDKASTPNEKRSLKMRINKLRKHI